MDVNCDKNFTDPYSLLYGHHMEESKMFGDLDLYKDAEFFAENTTGELILPDRTYDLQTFACLLVPSSESAIFQPQRWDSDLQGCTPLRRRTPEPEHRNAGRHESGGR